MIENIFTGSVLTALWIVPVLRELAGIFLAIYIAKNCSARSFNNKLLWAFFALVSPAFAIIAYFVKVKLSEDKPEAQLADKSKLKASKKYFAISFVIYTLAFILIIVSTVLSVGSGIAGIANGDLDFPTYYDSEGVEHEDYESIPVFDREGNEYHLDEVSVGFNANSYYDKDGNEYDLENCYISKDGYFYYDKNGELEDTHESNWYYSKHWKDKNGMLYAHIDEGVVWDEEGDLCIIYHGGHIRKAFD